MTTTAVAFTVIYFICNVFFSYRVVWLNYIFNSAVRYISGCKNSKLLEVATLHERKFRSIEATTVACRDSIQRVRWPLLNIYNSWLLGYALKACTTRIDCSSYSYGFCVGAMETHSVPISYKTTFFLFKKRK